MQSANGLKVQVGAKKSDATTITIANKEKGKGLGKSFEKPLDFYFLKCSVYLCEPKENLTVRLELNSSDKVT